MGLTTQIVRITDQAREGQSGRSRPNISPGSTPSLPPNLGITLNTKNMTANDLTKLRYGVGQIRR